MVPVKEDSKCKGPEVESAWAFFEKKQRGQYGQAELRKQRGEE